MGTFLKTHHVKYHQQQQPEDLNLHSGQEFAIRSGLVSAEISAQHLEMIPEANPSPPIISPWDGIP
jgi:hypothetical protein